MNIIIETITNHHWIRQKLHSEVHCCHLKRQQRLQSVRQAFC